MSFELRFSVSNVSITYVSTSDFLIWIRRGWVTYAALSQHEIES